MSNMMSELFYRNVDQYRHINNLYRQQREKVNELEEYNESIKEALDRLAYLYQSGFDIQDIGEDYTYFRTQNMINDLALIKEKDILNKIEQELDHVASYTFPRF